MLAAAGMDHYRPGHDNDSAAALAQSRHLPRDLLDDQLNAPLARDAGAHERKLPPQLAGARQLGTPARATRGCRACRRRPARPRRVA